MKEEEFMIELYKEGREVMLEMHDKSRAFLPYFLIMKGYGVKHDEEIAMLFGLYLRGRKRNKEGFKIISESSFEKFMEELPTE